MSYLWMVGLVMRLFSCWANLWRSSACIKPKKVQPLGIYFWHLRLGLFKSPFLVGEAEHMWLQPFARTNVFSTKNMCFAFWARVDTKCLNLSHHFVSMDGWPGDATFSCGANLWRSSACIQPKKVQPLGIYFWHLRLGLFKSPFWLVKLNICGCSLLLGQIYFQPKKHAFCILSAHWHKILEFVPSCPIYGWLAWWCDFFSCWANLWRSSACIQPKKVQPLGIYFWHLRLGLFKSPCLVGEAEHMWLQPFARTNVFSAKNMCFAFWARFQDKCIPLQGQMYLWNLFLISNLRTFNIIIIITYYNTISTDLNPGSQPFRVM